jgi:hypothetical protein
MLPEELQDWQRLCAQAATEKDPARLMALIDEINRILREKEERLAPRKSASGSSEP